MLARDGASPTHRVDGGRARSFVGTGKRDGQTSKPQENRRQDAIHAELTGSNTCEAAGITARGRSPVLALCRVLLQAGFDPDRPLHACRGATLCLIVRSIGAAAGLDINSKGTGFIRQRAVRAAPPIRQKRRGAA